MINMLVRLFVLLLALGVATTITLVSSRRRGAPGATSLIVFALALAIWAVSDTLHAGAVFPGSTFWQGVTLLGATLIPASLVTFALEYTNRERWLTWRVLALLAVEPALTQILFWNAPWRGLFFNINQANTVGGIPFGGLWFWINSVYSIGLMLVALYWFVQAFLHGSLPYRLQSGVILVGICLPLILDMLGLAVLVSLPSQDLSLMAFTFTGLVFIYDFFKYRLLDIVPIERAVVVERMNDGWMVLDEQNRIVDMNRAAELVVGFPRQKIFGQPAEGFLSNWQNLTRSDTSGELELRGSVNMGGEWRYFNVRISPLADQRGHDIGKIVFWRDITERRKVDEARQRARDEMFILLHSISGAASRALNVNDFLAETIHQVAYSFHSQSSVIFLIDELDDETEGVKLVLAAHNAFPDEAEDRLWPALESSGAISEIVESRQPLLISDVSEDGRLPQSIRGDGRISVLIAPMAAEEQVLGVIGLARKESPVYSADETARLTVVAEEVATLIHSDRQRQLSIAVAERQRLVRDLHDSVTQKLYGLVTLTEAAQAGLEVGSTYEPTQVLSRIGEYARQALKEMRLFLYELQPVDLESDGLVAVLHHRLAAVEGRSDVKARLLADGKISLNLDKEIALYFIAQEALNNILRHASAKSVTVRLRQRKVNIMLEIEDDGCGFDLQKSDKGGLGLRNMRERALQVGGKLKIVSTPEKGTKITITVRKDKTR